MARRRKPSGRRTTTWQRYGRFRPLSIYCVTCHTVTAGDGCGSCGATIDEMAVAHARIEPLGATTGTAFDDCCVAAPYHRMPVRSAAAAHWRHDHTNYDTAVRNLNRRFLGTGADLRPALLVLRERAEALRVERAPPC